MVVVVAGVTTIETDVVVFFRLAVANHASRTCSVAITRLIGTMNAARAAVFRIVLAPMCIPISSGPAGVARRSGIPESPA